jgi:HSP20 family molecular chaperone IbpA
MPAQPAVYEPLLPLADVAGDGAWSPHVDVRELPNEYIVLADLPGVEPGAVAVTPKGDTLTITGARRDRLHAGGVPFRLERPTGKLRRSVPLPGPCEPTKIRTQIRDGVLEIRVPKGDDAGLTADLRVEEQPHLRWSTCPQRVRGTSLAAEHRGRTKVAPACKTRRTATSREARKRAPLP